MSIPTKFELTDFDDRFKRVRIYVMHDQLNFNNSFFGMESIEDAKDSICNIPILAFIKQVDGSDEVDFGGHEIEIILTEGDYKVRYLGRPIGVIPSDNNNYHYESIDEKTYVVVDGYIWVDYANEALDILERDKEKPHSMEIKVLSYSYNSQNKYTEITKYLYTGLTLLGSDVTPAMVNSKATLFSKCDSSDSWQKMINELALSFTKEFPQKDNVDDIISVQKGDDLVDEKLKMLESFSVLKKDIEAFGVDLENISLDELKVKIEEYQKQKANTDQFTLTSEQLKDELRIELSKEKHIDDWGYKCRRYWYVDHFDSLVIAEDCAENYKLFAFTYSVSDDKVIIDFNSKKRYKITYVPFEDEAKITEFTLITKERSDYELDIKQKELQKGFAVEKETLIKDFEAKLQEVNDKYSQLENQNKELQEYKQNKLNEERELAEKELFSHFSKLLTEDELQPIKDQSSQFTISELKKELYILVGKKNSKFTANKQEIKESKFTRIPINTDNDNKYSKSYEHLIQQYINK
ncbi:MAG: hypothetical protein PHU66_08045 [Bacteroidaceae bacterium]|nr:hypothetical protein [Bacteroidaceae bacterium]